MADLFGTYRKRIKLDTKNAVIDEDLTWFPVTVFLKEGNGQTAEVFAEFDTDEDFDRIAFTTADGVTQLYAECELFDVSESVAIYHVSKTGWVLDNDVDTDFYYYYDKDADHNTTYISAIGSVIDVGTVPTDRESYYKGDVTLINMDNPANDTGKITRVSLWVTIAMASAKFATFYREDPDNFPAKFTARDVSDDVGAVPAGLQSFIVDIDVTAGDFIGIYFTDSGGRIDKSNTGGSGMYGSGGDQTACSNTTFSLSPGYAMSLSAIGSTSIVGSNVWDSNYKLVTHMVDATTSTVLDSTSNNNDGTKKGANDPASAGGKVGLAQNFDGSNDVITINDANSLDVTQNMTLEALAKTTTDATTQPIIGKGRYGTSTYCYLLGLDSGGAANNKVYFSLYDGTNNPEVLSTSSYAINNYYYLVGTYDHANLKIYFNGANEATTPAVIDIGNQASLFKIGEWPNATSFHFDNIIDEVRISSVARSDAWIKATYNSLWDTLLTYGDVELAPEVEVDNAIMMGMEF